MTENFRLTDAFNRAEWLIDDSEELNRIENLFDEALEHEVRWEVLGENTELRNYSTKISEVCKALKIDGHLEPRVKIQHIRYRVKENKEFLALAEELKR